MLTAHVLETGTEGRREIAATFAFCCHECRLQFIGGVGSRGMVVVADEDETDPEDGQTCDECGEPIEEDGGQ